MEDGLDRAINKYYALTQKIRYSVLATVLIMVLMLIWIVLVLLFIQAVAGIGILEVMLMEFMQGG